MSLNFLVFNEREAHAADIFSLAANDDAVISTSSDGTIKYWDLVSNDLVRTIDAAFEKGGHSIAAAEQITAAVGFAGDLHVYDAAAPVPSSETRAAGSRGRIDASSSSSSQGTDETGTDWAVAISPDASTIATTTSTGHLHVYDRPTASLVARIATRGQFGLCVAYAPDARSIATGHVGGGLFTFDTAAGTLRHALAASSSSSSSSRGATVRTVAYSPDSERLAAAGDGRAIALHDVRTGEQVASLAGHAHPVTALAWNASGELLVSAALDGRIKLWHTGRRECVGTFTENVGHKVWSVVWCKMGINRLEGFVVGGSERRLRFYLPTST